MKKEVNFKWWDFLQGLGGLLLGFFFAEPITSLLVKVLSSDNELPSYIPSLLSFITAGGAVGIVVGFIIVILGFKTIQKFSTLIIWLMIGIILSIVLDYMNLHPYDIIKNFLGFLPFVISMAKTKLILVGKDEQQERVKNQIIKLVNDAWLKNEKIIQNTILKQFANATYGIGETTVRKILDELVQARKISSWYDGSNRCYGPPKIPLSIKVGIGSSVFIIVLFVLIDIFIPNEILINFIYVYNPDLNNGSINTFPFVFYGICIVIFFTLIWYYSERNLVKK